uniref:Selenoprotein O n=1 Tax=Neolamprologus brichardi TaxID=32507 RepID=A0A3Q4GDP5_NEOBR
MESAECVPSALGRLPFNNTVLKKLPIDDSDQPGSRVVPEACFSRVRALQPLVRPVFVALSQSALSLLGLSAQEVLSDPLGPEYLSGSRLLPGSEPAAHCYCGHQFGLFAGQLGDGAVMYLGEVESCAHGRWEVQVKGAGVTPYSRYCLLPLTSQDQICPHMVSTYVDTTFWTHLMDKVDIYTSGTVFLLVMTRTARLVAQWQCVGFCHGVLNTDNMSILGLTLDYGPFGFMERFDPDFVSNASDKKRRYSYQSQPSVCRWNLARLAEALGSELDPAEAGAVLDEFMPTYKAFYLSIMRKKLGLVRIEEVEDRELVSDLLRVMHNTGADFTNTFRLLSCVPWPEEGDSERATVGSVVDLILEQWGVCELAMILSLAQTNPLMFGMVADSPGMTEQLELLGRLKELVETNQDDLKRKQRDDWIHWIGQYRMRLGRECDSTSDLPVIIKERLKVMNGINPRVVLRNYIAQNAIQAAEKGDFSEVRVLKVLEKPYSDPETLFGPDGCGEVEHSGAELDVAYDGKPPAWAQTLCVT